MDDISLSAELHLECVRGGGCCHGHRIQVTPWEIACLARQLGMPVIAFRDRHTADGATFLLPDGALDGRGLKGCGLFRAGVGCTAHAARPLACRMYPLGRRLIAGRVVYHHPGRQHGCYAICPDIESRPPRVVGEWLAEQGVHRGEAAHDAYGRLANGLLRQAVALIPDHQGRGDLVVEMRRRAALAPGARAALLSPFWYNLVTAPPLDQVVDEPETFVYAHAERLLTAVADGMAGKEASAAVLLATIGKQLALVVGTQPAEALTAMVILAA